MKFAIINGLPYLIKDGFAIPVEIADGNVRLDISQSAKTEDQGKYGLQEVMAKCGRNISSIPKKQKAKKVDDNE